MMAENRIALQTAATEKNPTAVPASRAPMPSTSE